MWERFDKFADDFVRRAQRVIAQSNAGRPDDGIMPEVSVVKLRVEFARDTGPTTTGSVLVLKRSSYVPMNALSASVGMPATPADLLDVLDELDRRLVVKPSATWWLTFTPGSGDEDEWHFDHADTQDANGRRVRARDTAWIEALMPMRRGEQRSGFSAADLDVELVPTKTRRGYGPVFEHRIPQLTQEADDGAPTAQFLLGVTYAMGGNVELDLVLAVDRLKQAASCGYLPALLVLGWMVASGRGVARDPQRAEGLWRRAIAQGLPRAQCVLGALAQSGAGFPRDLEFAFECQSRAAAGGSAHAEFRLARLLHQGVIRPIDTGAAWHWYRRAAMHGLQDAFAELQSMPPREPREPWPGEKRATIAAWLRGRRSQANEREGAEAVLTIAQACDAAMAIDSLSPEHVCVLVAGACNPSALVWCSTHDALLWLQDRGIDVSPVLLQLCDHESGKVRIWALRTLRAATPQATIERLLDAGREDEDDEVRQTAATKAKKLHRRGLEVAA